MKCCNGNDGQTPCGCSKAMPVIIAIIVLALAGYGVYKFMNKPDERTAVERVGDAIKQLPNGVDAASKQLEDKSATEKLGEDLKELVK